jgi:hypothetical protein
MKGLCGVAFAYDSYWRSPSYHPAPPQTIKDIFVALYLLTMSLVSGPGRGGGTTLMTDLPDELKLCVDKHVEYIQSLDKVRHSTKHLRLEDQS